MSPRLTPCAFQYFLVSSLSPLGSPLLHGLDLTSASRLDAKKKFLNSVSFYLFSRKYTFLLGVTTHFAVGLCIVTQSCHLEFLTLEKIVPVFTLTQLSDCSRTGATLSVFIDHRMNMLGNELNKVLDYEVKLLEYV